VRINGLVESEKECQKCYPDAPAILKGLEYSAQRWRVTATPDRDQNESPTLNGLDQNTHTQSSAIVNVTAQLIDAQPLTKRNSV
jgi:hypothetical protein